MTGEKVATRITLSCLPLWLSSKVSAVIRDFNSILYPERLCELVATRGGKVVL